jgi:hypothetical protein
MPRPEGQVSALPGKHETRFAVNSEAASGAAYFLSERFLRPYYRGSAWAYPFPPPMAKADMRAAMLQGAGYLDAALDAQIEGDDGKLVNALEVVAGFVAVVLGQLHAPSEHSVH